MRRRAYFSAGMTLLDESDWGSHYELTFHLWLERAECEFLNGHLERAEQLIGELLQPRGFRTSRSRMPPT